MQLLILPFFCIFSAILKFYYKFCVFKGDRKRRYHSTYEVSAPSEADIEAYKLTTIHSADPMAAYMLEKRRKK